MNNNDSTIEAERNSGVAPATLASLGLSIVRDDPAFRLQRKLGLIPETGLGIARRALFWSLLAWLPIAVWAAWTGRAIGETAGEPLLAQFGIHLRFLVAVPLLIFAEGAVHTMSGQLLLRFVTTGIVPADQVAAMQSLIGRLSRLRDSVLPWIAILGIVIAVVTVSDVLHRVHEVEWATDPGDSRSLGFGAWWFLYVGRPIYLTLLLGWAWRVILLFLLFGGIARLRLSIVPTHPDRTGGLGFLARFPATFAPVVFAMSAVTAAMLAHDVVYHDISVKTFRIEMAVFTVIAVLVFLLPMVAFARPLARAKRRALLDYGALVGEHGRLVHQRWIEGKRVGEHKVLDAPELGPVADVATLYTAVTAMRTVPLSKSSVMPLLLAAVLPLLIMLALEIPVGQLLANIAKALL
jgi:hypothetical protein